MSAAAAIWPDPEYDRQMKLWQSIADKRRLQITGVCWRAKERHMTVDLAPRTREAEIAPAKPSRRSVSQGRLL